MQVQCSNLGEKNFIDLISIFFLNVFVRVFQGGCFALCFLFFVFYIQLLYEKATYPNAISRQLMSLSEIFL